MFYIVARMVLSGCYDVLFHLTVMRLLTIRSKPLYCCMALAGNATSTLLYYFAPDSLLRPAIGTIIYIALPVALSADRMKARLSRPSVLYLILLLNELLSGSLYMLITRSAQVLDHIGPDNMPSVVTVYLVSLIILALVFEVVVAQFARIDSGSDPVFESPVIGLVMASLLSLSVSYLRLYGLSNEALRQRAMLLSFGCLWVSLLVIYVILIVVRRDADAMRRMTNQVLALRKTRHTHREVEAMAQRAEGMRSLRHELANQVRTISTIAESGNSDEASSRLANLRAQVHVLKGMD